MSNKDLYQLDKFWLEQNYGVGINPAEFSDRVTKRVDETQLDDNSARYEVLAEMENEKK